MRANRDDRGQVHPLGDAEDARRSAVRKVILSLRCALLGVLPLLILAITVAMDWADPDH